MVHLSGDLKKLVPEHSHEGDSKRIYLYVGTITEACLKSVTARFLGELCGAQVSTDCGKSFDTDFAVSCVIAFLSEKGIDVYFNTLSDTPGTGEEVRIAQREQPLLQKVTTRRVCLHPDIKRVIAGKGACR